MIIEVAKFQGESVILKSCYFVLGLPVDSLHDYINAACRRFANEYHPDHAATPLPA